MASYKVISKFSENSLKVSMYVQFNGQTYDPKIYPNGGEFVEIESLDPVVIDAQLIKIATDHENYLSVVAPKSDLKVDTVTGKIVPNK